MKQINESYDYYKIVKKILNHREFKKRKKYRHHGEINVYDHSISVSKLAYTIARKINISFGRQIFNEYDVAIGGLLHDFYYKDYTLETEKKPLLKKHGFVHAKEAYDNSLKFFPEYINQKTKNIILRHMFPLNIMPPKYIESWLITIVDKYVSMEVFPYLFKKVLRRFS